MGVSATWSEPIRGRRIIANQTMLRAILAIMMLLPAWRAGADLRPRDPMSLHTRDAHQDLTIVADPYLKAERYKKEIFGKDSFYAAGIVAIDVYFQERQQLADPAQSAIPSS